MTRRTPVRTPVRVAALAAASLVVLAGCGLGPTRTPTSAPPAASGGAASGPAASAPVRLPVGTTPTMTTWGQAVDLPGVGSATFTREGDDALVELTASVAGVRLGLSRGARLEDDVAFACNGQVVSGAAPDGGIGAGRTAVVRYEKCATGDVFAWNYMVDGERTLSVGVENT